MVCFILHNWSKWGKPYKQYYTVNSLGITKKIDTYDLRQKRTCSECDKLQIRIVE